MIINKELKSFLTIVTGALILLCAAYFNGFPIVYSDTSTYLDSGFKLETPFDRPITYGLFLRFASLNGISLWLVIFGQSFILSTIIYLFIKKFWHSSINIHRLFFLLMPFLAILTSASWTSSQLISDIFTPIMILSTLLLIFEKWNIRMQFLLFFIFLFSTTMHMSHITFNAAFLISILVLRIWNIFGLKDFVRLKPVLICLLLSVLSIATMGSALSKSKHAFLMGALVEHGIAKTYLDEHCGTHQYEFCKYKDSLPVKAWQFIWDESSPFHKMGGFQGTKEEFNEIIYGTLTSPKYLTLHVKESLKATGDQLIKFRVGDGNGPYLQETQLYQRIELHFPHEIGTYNKSLQNKSQFGFLDSYNLILGIVLIISVLVAIFIYLKSTKQIRALILMLLLALIFNAWVCGTFANAIDRLGAKVFWMIPMIAFIGLIQYFKPRDQSAKK